MCLVIQRLAYYFYTNSAEHVHPFDRMMLSCRCKERPAFFTTPGWTNTMAVPGRTQMALPDPAFRPEFAGSTMKKPSPELRRRMCTGKRRYRTQGDALDAAMIAGVEQHRQAYRCQCCGQWHLTSR